ncbi:MAG: 3'-5' exonuclease, partial [Gemmatimonadetes bacterium]|nr:3'-5' exonuclease [Gemmatimonadota bacterium]
MALTDETYIVLDFETNGLAPARGGEVIEVGAVRVERGRTTGTFDRLARSNHPIPPSAVGVHGITDEMIAGAPHFAEMVQDLLEFVGDAVVVAHNAGFDRRFLLAGAELVGARRPDNPFVDTLKHSRALDP